MKQINLPTVAIVGRPNVGKSSLFNRLIGKRLSITSSKEGVTRDRLFNQVKWLGKSFNLIDSGGFLKDLKKDFQQEINAQVEIAINESELVLFLVDSLEGVTKNDLIIAKKLKAIKNKKIITVVNKSDNRKLVLSAFDFYELGFGEPIAISSIHGIGISDLLDAIIKILPIKQEEIERHFRLGIIGKPNVGKSTLANTLLNDQRTIVSSISGTTRDAIDSKLIYNNNEYIITDTAGLKRNKQALDDIEWYAELRTNLTINNSDLNLLLIEHVQGITVIDEKIMGIIKEQIKPAIILVNKSDLISYEDRLEIVQIIKDKFKFASYVPVEFISAKNNKNIPKIFSLIEKIRSDLVQEINKSKLNDFLMDLQMIKKPPRHHGIEVKLSYITYSNTYFPHFIIFSNHPKYLHFSYLRFIENQIRKIFDFTGIPIKITVKKKNQDI
ncbi:MAG: ribosome biogenesis GTPase Der [Mycoplasmataceae bacterium]|nr:ribosome biogenesis GTPase Der [Mycoplasmataceae bacterium]